MKLSAAIFSAALAAPFNECPGSCWTQQNGVCVPDMNKVRVSCTAGSVGVTAKSCLFLNDNADFTNDRSYEVFFKGSDRVRSPLSCIQSLKKHEDSFTGSWTFEELETCGWAWSADDDKLTLANSLQISNTPHLVHSQGITIQIGTKIQEIPLKCDFSRELTLQSEFDAVETALSQDGTTLGSNDFAAVFAMQLNEFDSATQSYYRTDGVTVGEPLQVDIDLDVGALGYTSTLNSRIGFFAEKCGITDSATMSTNFFLVGSENGDVVKDNCLLGQDVVNLTQKMGYENGSYWSKTQFDLEFDVFRFPQTGSLKAFCHLKMCLDDDCPTEAKPDCDAL